MNQCDPRFNLRLLREKIIEMNKYKKVLNALLLLLLCFGSEIFAQNIESIGKEKPLKLTGGLSANQVLYLSNDSIRRRAPYNCVASGNINFNIYGWNVPFSYTISNYENSYQQPFNQYSINPTYKWVTLHAGYSNMNFSPFTLSGHSFLGAGVEIAPPGIFRFSLMYGRLMRAIEPDTANSSIVPSYRRIGYGFKAGIVKSNSSVELIVFKASDDKSSLKSPLTDSLLKPQENLTLALSGKLAIIKNFTVNAEIAGSALTDNLNDPQSTENKTGRLYSSTGLYKSYSSSMFYKALKAGMNYSFEKSIVGIAYERIDPGYKTLGAYYSNNDYENYTVNASTSLFNKVNLSLSAGIQKDDLDHKKSSNTQRFVSSVNVTYNVNEKLNINTSYSGFQTFTRVRSQFEDINRISPYQYIDTLNFTQLTNSLNTNISYNFAKSSTKQEYLSLNMSYQKANDKQSSRYSGSNFINTNVSYSHTRIPIGLTATASFNASSINAPGAKSITLGPNISISKNMLKKTLRPTFSLSLNNSYSNGGFINSSFIPRLMTSYIIRKKHNLTASFVFASLKNKTENETSNRNDFTGTMGYSFNF